MTVTMILCILYSMTNRCDVVVVHRSRFIYGTKHAEYVVRLRCTGQCGTRAKSSCSTLLRVCVSVTVTNIVVKPARSKG
jgi:hypothetical protein